MADAPILLASDASFPLPALDAGAPPREIRLFKIGDNPSVKGVFYLDAEGAAAAVARFLAQGEDLPIDYNHWSEQVTDDNPATKTPEATRAAGWFGLEARPDGLYAVAPPHLALQRQTPGVYFTPLADQGLRQLEWRYFSPTVLYQRMEDGRLRVGGITSFALTHRPALVGQQPILASAITYHAYPVKDGAWDGDGAEMRLRRWASSDGSGDPAKLDWGKYAEGFAWVDSQNREALGSYKLPHHDVVDGKLVTSRAGVEAAAAVLQGSRGGASIPASDISGVKTHLAEHYHQWGGTAPWEEKANMSGEQNPNVITLDSTTHRALLDARTFADGLRMLTLAQDLNSARATIEGWKKAAEREAQLAAENLQLRREKLEGEAKALLGKAAAEKKVTPAEEPELLKAVMGDGKVPPGQEQAALEAAERQLGWLRSYLSVKTPILVGPPVLLPKGAPAAQGQQVITEAPRNQVTEQVAPLTVRLADKDLKYEELSNLQKAELAQSDPQMFSTMREDWQRRHSRRGRTMPQGASYNTMRTGPPNQGQ